MGYGFPAAIGAQVAYPGRTVIDIAGDGSIQMNIQEIATAVQYKLPVKVMILNNGYLGMVRQWQALFYKGRYSHTSMAVSPDFVKLAEAYGAQRDQGRKALNGQRCHHAEALEIKGPVFVDFVVRSRRRRVPHGTCRGTDLQHASRMRNDPMRHAISVLVDNQAGVLSRVVGLFSGRGFNIESLSVAPTLDPSKSKIIIVTTGNEQVLEQIKKQLNKLINVVKVVDCADKDYVEREMIVIKVKAEQETRAEVLRIAEIFRAKVIDISPSSYTLSLTGDVSKLEGFIEILDPHRDTSISSAQEPWLWKEKCTEGGNYS